MERMQLLILGVFIVANVALGIGLVVRSAYHFVER